MIYFLVFISLLSIVQLPTQSMFSCEIDGKGIRFLFLHFEQNLTILSPIQNASRFDSNLKTFIVIHGWMEHPRTFLNLKLAETIAKYEPSNVIVMDFTKWSQQLYTCAEDIVIESATALAEFLIKAAINSYVNLDKVHVIAFSIGAHVAGLASRIVKANLNQHIHRLTALDPAGPLFKQPTVRPLPELALRKNDAVIVDVLHTTSLLGTWQSTGKVDFYAIGPFDAIGPIVSEQPGCIDNDDMSCSHLIARKYYIESITSCGIKGEDIENESRLVTFGHHMPDDTLGVFKFEPNFSSPFGKYSSSCNNYN